MFQGYPGEALLSEDSRGAMLRKLLGFLAVSACSACAAPAHVWGCPCLPRWVQGSLVQCKRRRVCVV